jgi:hypothetical protein
MEDNLVKVGGITLLKHSEEEYEYEDEGKGLNFYFVIDEPHEVAIIVFDDSLPKEKSNEACLGTLSAECLADAVKETTYITKQNVNDFVMWK